MVPPRVPAFWADSNTSSSTSSSTMVTISFHPGASATGRSSRRVQDAQASVPATPVRRTAKAIPLLGWSKRNCCVKPSKTRLTVGRSPAIKTISLRESTIPKALSRPERTVPRPRITEAPPMPISLPASITLELSLGSTTTYNRAASRFEISALVTLRPP